MADEDDRNDALKEHGWTTVTRASVEGEITYTSTQVAGHRIVVDTRGYGWKHFDGEGFLIGHSRYGRRLGDHLRKRAQF